MQNYETAEEKAAEWDVTPRHVQYLCRTGKINGAIKRAGVWFIPDNTATPVKNTKANAQSFQFIGTKKKIFESAIELFMLRGFNDISLRDIAESVGIQQSTIYNHFNTKQEILDTIYDFYCRHYTKNRPGSDEMDNIIREGSLMDIMNSIRYDFEEDYLQKMSDITKIIFQRMNIDGRAREIAKSLFVDEGIKYVEDVFKRAVEIGRLAPFNTHAIAVLINSVRMFTLCNWLVDPSPCNMDKLLRDEQTLYGYAAGFIKDLK